jgi:1,4-dihydroxy-2-naphthoate octaprenyltransferase
MKTVLGTTRPPFLILTPACVAVGVGTAFWKTGRLDWLQVLLVLIGALSAHVCVNVFNEYFDFKSGLDARTQRTPFSGGSGTLPANPALHRASFILAWLTFAITAAVGAYFVWLRGWQLLLIGVPGLILLVTYTIWWVYRPIFCLLAPGLGFGILMVMGTHFALTGEYTWISFMAALVPTFLVSNLLLLNQFPDVEADQSIRRRHYPITIGRKASSALYGSFMLGAYLSIILGVVLGWLPAFSLIALATAIIGWRAYQGARMNAENIPALIPSLGQNVIVVIATPALLAVGLVIGRLVS